MNNEKTKLLGLQEDNDAKIRKLAALSEENDNLESSNTDLKKKVANINSRLKKEKTRADANKKYMRQYYEDLKKAKAELKEKQGELKNLENKIQAKDEPIKSKDKKLTLITELEEKNRSFGKVLVYIVSFIFLSVFSYIAYIYKKKIHGKRGDEDYMKFCPDENPITKEIVRQLIFYNRASYWVRRSMEGTFFLLFAMMIIFVVLLIVEGASSLILFVNMNFWVVVSAIGFPFVTITSTYNIVESKKNEVLKMLAEQSKV